MTIKDAAGILRFKRDDVKIAIVDGIELPITKTIVKLEATLISDEYDIDDAKLDEFIKAFDKEQPGRHPPTAVCRELLVEARHRCAICENGTPIEFHHLIEYSTLKHYDVRHMLAVCPNCHTRCGNGEIDQKSQRKYKERLKEFPRNQTVLSNNLPNFLDGNEPIRFSWDDLKELISAMHVTIASHDQSKDSKYDYTNIDLPRKNKLNRLGEDYFEIITDQHEPHFPRIREFLGNPMNDEIANLYYDIVEELRTKVAAHRDGFDRFEHLLLNFADAAYQNHEDRLKGKKKVLNVLLSFMYANCDIGRKS